MLISRPDNDEEFLLDAPDTLPEDGSAFAVVEEGSSDDGMAIDEEGRPRFAPAKDIVRSCQMDWETTVLTLIAGPGYPSRDSQDPYPPSPNDTAEEVVADHLPSPCRAPEAAMPNEHQAKDC